MNLYQSLNELIQYIEENLEKNLDIQKMAKIVGVNPQTLQSLFSLVTNIGLAEYIRNRKLSKAVEDLKMGKNVMEVAIKYGYNSATAFSRSFTKFHGIKPREAKKEPQLRNEPILHFAFDNESLLNMSYRIETRKTFKLYGVKKVTNEKKISYEAPKFFNETKEKYFSKCGNISFGMVWYKKRFVSDYLEYWCLYKVPQENFLEVTFPSSKWLVFKMNNTNARNIQNLSHMFYEKFLPKNEYRLRELPELEAYLEDGTMEFRIAIE